MKAKITDYRFFAATLQTSANPHLINTMTALPKIEEIEETLFASEIPIGANLERLKIDFSEENPKQLIRRLKNITFTKCIFSRQSITHIAFIECKFIDCQFNGSKINACEFHKCEISNSVFYKASFRNTYIDPRSFHFDRIWLKNWANVNAWLFQDLYRNAKDMHQDEFARHADNKFLLYKRYEHLNGKSRNLTKFIKGLLFDWLLGNGYSIKKPVIITAVSILAFAEIIKDEIGSKGDLEFYKALYFSVVSFTTVGYGDISPEKTVFALSVTMLFLLASVVWCALVTAIIIKRIVK